MLGGVVMGSRRQDKAAAALSDAERCVEVEPSWAKGYSRMGTALFRLGRHAQAAAAYSKGEPFFCTFQP